MSIFILFSDVCPPFFGFHARLSIAFRLMSRWLMMPFRFLFFQLADMLIFFIFTVFIFAFL